MLFWLFVIILIAVTIFGSKTIERRKLLKDRQNLIYDQITGAPAHVTGDLVNIVEQIKNGTLSKDYMPEEMWKNVINACIKHEKCNAISSGPERFYTQVIDESNFKESLFKHMYNLGLEPEITGKITNHEIIQTYLLDRNELQMYRNTE